jgi:protein tyrosine kinase modulator
MLGQRQLSFDDYLDIFRRRWWIVLIPTVLLCAGVYGVSLYLPDQYTSRTLVLVEQQKVPESYVKSVVTEDIGERLGTMQEQILSRTRLQPIIEKFGLFKNQKSKMTIEEQIDAMRKAISVTPIRSMVSTNSGDLPGFSITFTDSDPHLAQQVCAEITSMFIQENLRLREQNAVGTTDFMKDQLADAKRALDDQDAKLADFQRKFMGSLPGNEQTDMNVVAGLSSQLDAVTSQLNRAGQDKAYEESLLAQQLSTWKTSLNGGGPHVDTLEQQLSNLEQNLVSLQAQYTDDYPDVVKAKADIAALKKQIAAKAAATKPDAAQATVAANLPEPPSIQQLRFQIHQNELLIQEKSREQTRIKQQLGAYQSRLSMSPAVEEEYKKITRDSQTAQQFYDGLLAKKNESEMATDLERRQQGEQFQVMDPADLPQKPSFPNRPAFAGGGLAGGLALGVGIILLLEMRDKSLRTENDVEQFLGLPTLAMVPVVGEKQEEKKRKKPTGKGKKAGLSPVPQA